MTHSKVAALLVLAALAAPAFATDRRVPSQAFPTIASAVAASQQGDRVLVGPGVYREAVVMNVPRVQIVGARAVWDSIPGGTTAPIDMTG